MGLISLPSIEGMEKSLGKVRRMIRCDGMETRPSSVIFKKPNLKLLQSLDIP